MSEDATRATARSVYYASLGPELSLYDVDPAAAVLTWRSTVTLPANIQYAWPHPSRRWLYVVSSNGGPDVAGDSHYASALAIDPTSGALHAHGAPAALPSRPIHTTVDRSGAYLLTAYNDPSGLTVHRLEADGTIGGEVAQDRKLDTGIFAHQVLTTPSKRVVLLVTRGNDAAGGRPEDPGAIKAFRFHSNGALHDLASIAPGDGLGFGPRHLDFHPDKPWVFVAIERQSQIQVYALDDATGIGRRPLFVTTTLVDPQAPYRQAAAAIHVHPNGRFVYVTNRSWTTAVLAGREVLVGGENSIAVFAVDQATGEPERIQTVDGRGVELRSFGIDASGRVLVAAGIKSMPVREDGGIRTCSAGLSVFQIGDDGRLGFVRKYDIDAGTRLQFWSGTVTLR